MPKNSGPQRKRWLKEVSNSAKFQYISFFPTNSQAPKANGIIPSYFSTNNMWNKAPAANHVPPVASQQQQQYQANNQVMNCNMSGGHRRLPATPKKPSTLFGKTASMAFNNISTQLPKPSSLALR